MIKKRIQVRVKDGYLVVKLKIPSNFIIDANQCNRLSQKYNYGFAKKY